MENTPSSPAKSKINLSKKQILLICIPLAVLILLVGAYFILKTTGIVDFGKNPIANTTGSDYADDSENARSTLFQTYTAKDTETTFKVYADMEFDEGVMEMTESCTYTDDTEPTDTVYTVGPIPTEIKNHCLLSFTEFYGKSGFFKTNEPFNAYILLPDGSLITVTTEENPTIQVNIYEKETRIVLLNGYAYFRVAPQEKDHKFSVQMMDRVMYVTGTEFFAGTSDTFSGEEQKWAHIEMYEGSGEVKLRTQDLIIMLTHKDYEQYGEWVEKNGVAGWYWYWDQQNTTSKQAHTFYSDESLNGIEEMGSADKITAGYMENVGNFIKSQLKTTLTAYGFGNYSSVVSQLEPFVDERIVSEQELRYEILAEKQLSFLAAYDDLQAYKENLAKKAEEAKKQREEAAKANKTVSVVKSTTRKCPTGTAYAGNGKCCPAGSYLGINGYCNKPGQTQSSSTTKPTTVTSTTTSSGGSGENCTNSGTAMYQACSMAAQGGSSGYYISGNKCCMPDVEEPTLEPVK